MEESKGVGHTCNRSCQMRLFSGDMMALVAFGNGTFKKRINDWQSDRKYNRQPRHAATFLR